MKEKSDVILYKDIVSHYCLETQLKGSRKLHTELLYFITSVMLFLIGEKISCLDKPDASMLQIAVEHSVLRRSSISYSMLEYSVTILCNFNFSAYAC